MLFKKGQKKNKQVGEQDIIQFGEYKIKLEKIKEVGFKNKEKLESIFNINVEKLSTVKIRKLKKYFVVGVELFGNEKIEYENFKNIIESEYLFKKLEEKYGKHFIKKVVDFYKVVLLKTSK